MKNYSKVFEKELKIGQLIENIEKYQNGIFLPKSL